MKLTFLHGLLAASILVAAREIIIYDNPQESNKSELEEYTKSEFPTYNRTIKKEPPEPFTVAYSKPLTALKKRKPLNSQQQLIERIKDYTVMIYLQILDSSYISGTGWFLDYEIPVYPKKYPTKWFVATNAHVVDKYPFSRDYYNQKPQVIKNSYSTPDFYLYRWESGGYDEDILRAKGIDYEEPTVWSAEWTKKHNPYIDSIPPSRDVLKIKKNWHRKKETPSMHIKIPEPKLLYAAFDELKDNRGNLFYYFMDFAVLEINFPDENTARKMTHHVYDKPESERMNFIEKADENSQFYTAGYPGNSFNPFRPVGNYSLINKRASKLGSCHPLGESSIYLQNWNGKKYKSNRCYQQMDYFYAQGGSSGSMVVDESGRLLGLHARGNDYYTYGFAQPIRGKYKSCWFFCEEEPEYDLIVGSKYQNTSYKQQLLYYLPYVNTYLKDKYKWGTTPPPTVEI